MQVVIAGEAEYELIPEMVLCMDPHTCAAQKQDDQHERIIQAAIFVPGYWVVDPE